MTGKQAISKTVQSAQKQPDFRVPEPFAIEAQGQALTFYPGGPERRQALLDLLNGAQSSIVVCFYIFAEDDAGEAVRDALVAAGQRGVDVRLAIDSFGSTASEAFLQPMQDAGVKLWRFSPKWSRRYLIRNHQKFVIVDEAEAMIGGFNCAHDYFELPERNGWHDLGVHLRGSAVDALLRWYRDLESWLSDDRKQWRAIRKLVREWDPGEGSVRLLIGGPTSGLSSWAKQVGRDLDAGRKLDMVMAYFSPPKRLLRKIGAIAERGETRLVMAGKSDNGATIGATRSLYRRLLNNGSAIYEFAPCKLHMKLIAIDDVVYLGSANFDMRSLYLNLELMLRIEDAALADRVRGFVEDNISGSEEITPESHARQATWVNRMRCKASWFLVSVLDYTVSRRLNLGQ